MADDIDLDNDEDFDIDSMFDDDAFESDTEELEDTGSRDPVDSVLKSTKNVISEKTNINNLLDTAGNSISKVMPNKISNEVDKLKEIKDAVAEPAMEQVKEISSKADEFLGNAKDTFGISDESFMGSMIDKIRDVIRPEDTDNDTEEKENLDEKIANDVSALLEGVLNKESVSESKTNIEQSLSNATQEELLSKVVSNLSVANDFNVSVANSYYRKSLELSFKQTLLQDSIFNLLKTNSELQGKQLESIVKNTALPDSIKMHNKDHLEKILKDKALNAGMDMLGRNNIVKNLKENITSSVEEKLSNIANGFDGINMAFNATNMASEAGITPMEMFIDTIISSGMNKASDKTMKFGMETLSKTKLGKDLNLSLDKLISDPKLALEEIKSKIEDRDDLGVKEKAGIRILEELTEAMGSSNVNDMKLTNQNPDDLTIFDVKTKMAITNVIPTLLSDIRNEVIGIRTGVIPTDRKIYDYDNGKFTTTTKLKNELLHTVATGNKSVAKDLDSSNLFNIFEYKNKLTKEERKIVKENYLQHLSEGGTISPYYLEGSGLFDKFSGKLKSKLVENVTAATKDNNNKKDVENNHKFVEYSKAIQNGINNNVNGLNTTALRLSRMGAGDVLEDIGLTDRNDNNKISADKINKLNNNVVKKYINGNVSIDDYGSMSADEISKAKIIKDKLIKNINSLKDNDITDKAKKDSLILLNKLPLKQILKYETYTVKNIRKLVFDLSKGRIDIDNDDDSSFMDNKFIPSFIKNGVNNIKNSDTIVNTKNNIKKFGEDKLGIDSIEESGNQVKWNEDDTSGKLKTKYKVTNLSKKRNIKENKKDRDIIVNNDAYTSIDTKPIIDVLNIHSDKLDNIDKTIKSINSKTILKDMLGSINNIYKLFKDKPEDKYDHIKDGAEIIRNKKNKEQRTLDGIKVYPKGEIDIGDIPDKGFKLGGLTTPKELKDSPDLKKTIVGYVHGDENVINSEDNNKLVDTINTLNETMGNDIKTTKENLIPNIKEALGNVVDTLNKVPKAIKENSNRYKDRQEFGQFINNSAMFQHDGMPLGLKMDIEESKQLNVMDVINGISNIIKDAFSPENKNSVISTMKNNMSGIFTSINKQFNLTDKYTTAKKATTDKISELDNKYNISSKAKELDKKYKDIKTNISNNKTTETINKYIRTAIRTDNDKLMGRVERQIDKGTLKTDDNEFSNRQNYFITKNISDKLTEIANVFNPKDKYGKAILSNTNDNKVQALTNFKDPNASILNKSKGIINNASKWANDEYAKGKSKVSDFLDLNNDIDINVIESKDDIDNSKVDLQEHLEEVSKDIKKEGLMNYLKELLSTESIPEDEEAEAFYTRILNTIDPLGKAKKALSAGGNFIRNMVGLHVSAISAVAKGVIKGGKFVKDQDVEKTGMVKGFLKGLVPPQLRFIFDNNTFGRMIKKVLPDMGKITKHLGNLVKDNLKVIKDTAKESFTDENGNTRVNLLRGAKFLGKSFVRTAKVTGRGIDGKGGIKGIYGETFKGVGEVGSTALRYGTRVLGIEKNIPFYRRTVIVESAPIPEEVKSLYFNKKIKFKEIINNLSDKDKKAYIKHLKTYKDKKTSVLGKVVNGLFKSTTFVGDKVLDPFYKGSAKAAYKGIKAGGKFVIDNELERGTASNIVTNSGKGFIKSAMASGGILNSVKNNIGKTFKNNKDSIINAVKSTIMDTDKKEVVKEKVDDITNDIKGTTRDTVMPKKKITDRKIGSTSIDAEDTGKESNTTSLFTKMVKSLESIKESLAPKKNKYNDKDGSGSRDGDYKDRMAKLFKKKDKKPSTIKKMFSNIKDNKSESSMLMIGLTMLGSTLVNFFKDGFMKGIGKVFNKVIWEPIKWLGSKLLEVGKNIISGIWKSISSVISKIPGVKAITNIKDTIGRKYKNIKNSTKKIISDKSKWFSNKWKSIKNFTSSRVNTIKNSLRKISWTKFKKYGTDAIDLAKKLVKKIGPALKSMKTLLVKKIGAKAAIGIFSRLGSKLIPVIGWGLLAYDAVKIAYDMIHNKTSFKSAVSKQLLGIDLFKDDTDTVENIDDDLENTISDKPISTNDYVNNTYTGSITKQSILSEIKTPIPNKGKLLADLIRDEGVKLHKYKDSLGYETVGVGHLVDKAKGGIPVKNIIGRDTDTITKPEAMKILAYDVNKTSKKLYSKIPWLKNKSATVQNDLINMGFNLGVNGLLGFKNTLKHIKNDDYAKAAQGLKHSKWYNQTGIRAKRIVDDMLHLSKYSNAGNNTNYTGVKYSPANNISTIINKNNSANIAAKVEKDKQQFNKNNMLNNEGTKVTNINREANNTDTLLNTIDKQSKHTETLTKVSKHNNDLTNSILKESLTTQQDILKVLTGIYTINKELSEKLTVNSSDTSDKEKNKKEIPKFIDRDIKHALNLNTGTF